MSKSNQECNWLMKQLETLLNDKEFKSELKAYRSAFQRLKVRLRNSSLIANLKLLVTSIRQVDTLFSTKLLQTYNRQINQLTGKKQNHTLKSLSKFISHLIEFTDGVLDRTLQLYCITQPHLKVGHLSHHLIILRTCLSRIRIYFKAMLIYATDLFLELSDVHEQFAINDKFKMNCDIISEILHKHECKPRNKKVVDITPTKGIPEETIDLTHNDEIGQLIDRSTMKPVICQKITTKRRR